MQTYNIIISETQRAILAKALKNTSFHFDGPEMLEEATLLEAMMNELPQDEAESPGCMHGFAL